jgi:hypothetical protein
MTKEIESKLDRLINIMEEHTSNVKKITELIQELKDTDGLCKCSLENLPIDDAIKILQERVSRKRK